MPTLDILWYESLTEEPRIAPSAEADERDPRRGDSDDRSTEADVTGRHAWLRARRAKRPIQ